METIQRYPWWAKVNASVWIVRTEETCRQVHAQLWRELDAEDRLFVIRTHREAAWRNGLCTRQWLQAGLQARDPQRDRES